MTTGRINQVTKSVFTLKITHAFADGFSLFLIHLRLRGGSFGAFKLPQLLGLNTFLNDVTDRVRNVQKRLRSILFFYFQSHRHSSSCNIFLSNTSNEALVASSHVIMEQARL